MPAAQPIPVGQLKPQAPQLFGSFAIVVHTPLHEIWPPGHMQSPLLHEPPVQVRPQSPQLFGSVRIATHPPAHSACPAAHGFTHVPDMQVSPWWQSCPHAPQLCRSIARFAHMPPGQVTAVLGHIQTPDMHSPAEPQELPHAPQLSGSAEITAHPPFGHRTASALQVQRPAEQVPPGPQLRPHAPQFAGSWASMAQPVWHATAPPPQLGAPGVPQATSANARVVRARSLSMMDRVC